MPSDTDDKALIESLMMHHHPVDRDGNVVVPRYCRKANDNTNTLDCRHGYPKPIAQCTYTGVDGRVNYRRRHEVDRMVVPHCLPLVSALRCQFENGQVVDGSTDQGLKVQMWWSIVCTDGVFDFHEDVGVKP